VQLRHSGFDEAEFPLRFDPCAFVDGDYLEPYLTLASSGPRDRGVDLAAFAKQTRPVPVGGVNARVFDQVLVRKAFQLAVLDLQQSDLVVLRSPLGLQSFDFFLYLPDSELQLLLLAVAIGAVAREKTSLAVDDEGDIGN